LLFRDHVFKLNLSNISHSSCKVRTSNVNPQSGRHQDTNIVYSVDGTFRSNLINVFKRFSANVVRTRTARILCTVSKIRSDENRLKNGFTQREQKRFQYDRLEWYPLKLLKLFIELFD